MASRGGAGPASLDTRRGSASPRRGGPSARGIGARLATRLPAGRDRPPTRHRRYCRGARPRRHRTRLADAGRGRPRRTTDRRQSLAGDVARTRRGTTARASRHPPPRSPIPPPAGGGGRVGGGLRPPDPGRGGGRTARIRARPHPRSDVRGEGLRLSPATCNGRRATGGVLAYVCRSPTGVRTVTSFGTVELTVYPYECDAYGHLNQAALLTLLERARWDALARGPGMDLFDRNGVWP